MGLLKKLIRKLMPGALVRLLEKTFRKSRGLFWQARYGFPARNMRVIAVTGTDGKTTTVAYINEVLKAAGYSTAVLNTVFYEFNGRKLPNKTHFTVHKQSIVQNFFARAKKSNVDWAVIEVTSQALDQDRIMGVPVEIAVVTNISQEHLDYHGTMKNYASAKASLLSDYGADHAVLNADNDWFDFLKERTRAEVFSFGKKPKADLSITDVRLKAGSSQAVFTLKDRKMKVRTGLPGEFNIYNAAAAASVGSILSVDPSRIEKGITALDQINGRMEPVNTGQDFGVYVDFAITPGAIREALISLQAITEGKVRIVFGATGDRDGEKRAPMGEAAAKHADAVYLTDDETYTEDPEKIRSAVFEGIKSAKGTAKTEVIADRDEAIRAALKDAKKDDAVLITGLGHEDSRNMGGKLVPWSDKKTAEKILKNL